MLCSALGALLRRGIPGNVTTSVLLELSGVVLVLISDAGLEGVVGVGLDEELADGVEDGADAAGGLPVLRLEHAEADGPHVVVGHVGVVDARRERHLRRLERVVRRQHDRELEAPARVHGLRGPEESRGPVVQVGFGGDRDGHAGWWGGHAFLQFLEQWECTVRILFALGMLEMCFDDGGGG